MAYTNKSTAIANITRFHFGCKSFDNFRNDFDVVLAAVKHNAFALKLSSYECRSNPEIVLAAVTKHKRALEYASPRLQEICKDQDPIKALESFIFKEKLQKQFSASNTQTRRIKL